MTSKRPTAVLVIAILQLVFGGLGLLCTAGSGVMAALDVSPRRVKEQTGPRNAHDKLFREMEQRTEAQLPSTKVKGKIYQGIGILLSLMMVASGIGLLRMAAWGWWLALAYACLSLLVNCLNIGYEELIKKPIQREIVAQLPITTEDEKLAVDIIQAVSYTSACMGMFFMVYPMAVLIFMVLPGVRSAFRRGPELLPPWEAMR